ncbi:hypothetical protein WJX77_000666 [Trebouxia sp. C0004]
MLKSSGVGAILTLDASHSRLTSRVPRRLTSFAQKRQKGHTYGIKSSADCMPQQHSWQAEPNTSLLASELQKQWHKKLNMHIGNVVIKPYSHRKGAWNGLSFLLRSKPRLAGAMGP